jgi:cellulose biosynthesis protein BcsQ
MVDRRKKLHRTLVERGPELVTNCLNVAIPYASVVERMGEEGKPLEKLDARSAAAGAYRQLWASIKKDLW